MPYWRSQVDPALIGVAAAAVFSWDVVTTASSDDHPVLRLALRWSGVAFVPLTFGLVRGGWLWSAVAGLLSVATAGIVSDALHRGGRFC